ncbi:uncharacterized protein LOC135499854 isoform X1 [Lineus longissimus]|uniref:uncharacterized protein LOC135499854 isoform X1 n=1 Tax=Lineus longissimus TaxID=88925 RepID=UPI00315CE3E8
MTKAITFQKLGKVVNDIAILHPDIGSRDVISLLACAIMCIKPNCSTINVLEDDERFVCQMSKKKGTCMEKEEEVCAYPSARMYERKSMTLITYTLHKKRPFIPPLIITKRDFMCFDRKSGGIVVLKQPSSSPFWRVLVYKLSNKSCTIQYNTKFADRPFDFVFPHGTYKHFITFACKNNRPRFLLYEYTQGSFLGKIAVPKNDVCSRAGFTRLNLVIDIQLLVVCIVRGHLKATIYDPEEIHKDGSFTLNLKNGIAVPLRIGLNLMIIYGDIYHLGLVRKRINVFAYRLKKIYESTRYIIKLVKPISMISRFYVNPWNGLFFIFQLPGPTVIAMKETYGPKAGLLSNGSGDMTFTEIRATLHPYSNETSPDSFIFNPSDGSLLHLVEGRRKPSEVHRLTEVEVYKIIEEF